MNGNNLDDHLRHGVVIENTYGSVVAGNMIEECAGTAIILDRDCYGNTISANVIAHNGGGVDLRDAWGCAVSANTFTINAARGLVIGAASGRITVTGNNFSNAHIGGKTRRDDAAAGILLEHTTDVAISGNVFTGMAQHAVKAEGTITRLVVTGNVMADLLVSEPKTAKPMELGGSQAVIGVNAIEE
jgi:parallel beta-helix repeat protein